MILTHSQKNYDLQLKVLAISLILILKKYVLKKIILKEKL